MGSKKKKKRDKKKGKNDKNTHNNIEDKLSKLDILVKIDDLKNKAQNYKIGGNYEKAISTANEIIYLAVKHDIPSVIKDQDEFLKTMAEKVQKEFIMNKIKEASNFIRDHYKELIKSNRIMQAHALIEGFKKEYDDFSYFNSMPIVQELIEVDKKNWLKYQVSIQYDKYKKILNSEKEEIEEIIRVLRKYYEELVNSGQIEEAEKLKTDFTNKYEDNSIVMDIPSVKEFIGNKNEVISN
ncbi:MAG: hypothetical protein GF383_14115 [Candidatus Lokiarchaeota archaeon]|nr:hypothetical protein [Candidatus Lokiarchaeota archaeon]MBD3342475.1 hypothetical protein [Candidatus Lokiarchaeota archaeon]